MKLRLKVWVLLSLVVLALVWLWWPRGHGTAGGQKQAGGSPAVAANTSGQPSVATNGVAAGAAKASAVKPGPFAYRLSNTTKSIGELTADGHAILLENALIDTSRKVQLNIPANLRAKGDPGAYIVQARGLIDGHFRALLASDGAKVVSYIPNNAYLVVASAGSAAMLGGSPLVQVVLPYEPYYKLQPSLLGRAVEQQPLKPGTALELGLFAANAGAAEKELAALGVKVIGRDESPFGPILRVLAPDDWTALAQVPGVQVMELAHQRVSANDLSRATLGVAADSITTSNWLDLSGSNVLVAVDDTGIDANHPDFSNNHTSPVRVFGPDVNNDTSGHGTHVAGIIAGDGSMFMTVSNAQGSIMPPTNGQFRGMAPLADLYSLNFRLSDRTLQEAAAQTNALISNNSWGYGGDYDYDLAAASYDAATRDALPSTNGPQPVLFVFAAGDDGNGNSSSSDTILSPGTAKNVITVGALEQLRNITNLVTTITPGSGTNAPVTNQVAYWQPWTDSSSLVAPFSSCGNVGVNVEGAYGRFKPDVVTPGTFVVSTRSEQWDTNAFLNPTNVQTTPYTGQLIEPGVLNYYNVTVPPNAVRVVITLITNRFSNPFPTNLLIYVRQAGYPTTNTYDFATSNNTVSIPPDGGSAIGTYQNNGFDFAVGNSTNVAVNYDMRVSIYTTNDMGDYYQVLLDMDNNDLGKWYRYESGTSMSAANVSGLLALLDDYFINTLNMTPSPALLKAMLINGARPESGYTLALTNGVNYQGWGLPSLPNSLPLTNNAPITVGASSSLNQPLFFVDQSPTNALATGESHTYLVNVNTNDYGNYLPLKATLVWTDPAGDPAAAIKLVNSLELVITNLDDPTQVYYGNDISPSLGYNLPADTNGPPNLDLINNVQNIILPPLLAGHYSVTVIGRSVNVNAVTTQTNTYANGASGTYAPNVVQDYALVVAVGEGEVPDSIMSVTDDGIAGNPTGDQDITGITVTNTPLMNQFVGASSPLLGTNTETLGANSVWGPNGQLVIGQTNQWHFYVVTNNAVDSSGSPTDVTNAAFITFDPYTLSIPRMGVYEDTVANATRPQADIDMFVTTDSNLLTLDPVTISNCIYGPQVGASVSGAPPVFYGSSLGRGGTEFVADTNSTHGQVYYIGVQSQDQMASEYAFLAVFTATPFSLINSNGDQVVNGLLLPTDIPDGSNAHPGVTNVFGLAIYPMKVGRVTVTNLNEHQNFGDLFGVLNFNGTPVVLNNHDGLGDTFGALPLVYDDSANPPPGTHHTDGPGSLLDYKGQSALGPWILTEEDNSLTQTGRVSQYSLLIQPHHKLENSIVRVTVPAHGWFYDYVDVTAGYTNLLVVATNLPPSSVPPIQLYLNATNQPTASNYLAEADLTNSRAGFPPYPDPSCYPGNSISYGPPLEPGTYWIGLYNPDTVSHDVDVGAFLSFNASAVTTVDWNASGALPLVDDAVMDSSIFVTNTDIIQGINVGLRVDHPRISDLVFTLISPNGTRYLLMENRGGASTNGCGITLVTTNVTTVTTNITMTVTNTTVITNNFEGLTAADYTNGQTVGGWTVTTNQVSLVTDPVNAYGGSNFLALANGAISYTLPSGITNGNYTLTFAYRGPGIVGWWRGESNANDSINGNNGTFLGDPRYTNGVVGQAFQMTGNGSPSSRVIVPDNPIFILTNALTVEGWAWISNYPSGGGVFFMRGDDRPGLDPILIIFDNSSKNLTFRIQQNNTTSGTSDLIYNFGSLLNQRLHLTCTWDGHDGIQRLYVNGVVVKQQITSVIPLANLDPASSPGLGIGNNQGPSAYDTPWHGYLDEMSLYKRALSASEIKAIYDTGSAGKFDPVEFTNSPSESLAEARVSIPGFTNSVILGNNTNWQSYSVTGAVPTNGAVLTLTGLEPGMLLDSVVLSNTAVMVTNVTLTYSVTNIATNDYYLAFTEDTNLTTTPIKYATTPFVPDTNQTGIILGTTTNLGNFETATAGVYAATSATVDGWNVISNQVSVVSDSVNAQSGSNFMALANGAISNNISTEPGVQYTLTFYYRGPGLISFWRGENTASDSIGSNNGTLIGGATYAVGKVGQSFEFNNVGDEVSASTVGMPTGTNDRTIDCWVYINSFISGAESYFAGYGNFGSAGQTYHFGTYPPNHALFFSQWGNIITGPVMNAGQWYYVAVENQGTNVITLFMNGTNVATGSLPMNTPTGSTFYIGGVNAPYTTRQIIGLVDDVGIYNRALSASEIKAIYQAGSAGKFDTNVFNTSPSKSLAEANLTIPNVTNTVFLGDNTTWLAQSITFTATNTTTPIVISGIEPGMLLDNFSMSTVTNAAASNLYYQPEQDISGLLGTSAYGNWTLEVLDNRAGATNNASLLNWQLEFTFANTNFSLATITNAFPGPVTNYIPGGAIQWYLVNVPTNADFATNSLLFATLPLNLWWSTNEPPTTTNVPPDTELLTGSTGGSVVLSTNGSPINPPTAFIEPGGTYYLGVQNPNVAGANYAVDVTFHLILTFLPPTVITEPATNIVSGAADLQGEVTPNSTNTTVYFDYGLDTNYLSGPSASVVLANNYTVPQWVIIGITNLAPPGSVWHYRAVGYNIYGTNYGLDMTFTNPYAVPPPYAFTMPATLVNGSSAQLNGMATPNGYDAKAWFEWGTSTAYGNPTPAVDVGANFDVVYVNTNIFLGAATNVTFHYRLVVSNVVGVTYGFDHVFNEGNLLAWGSDTRGQTTPIPSGLTNNLVTRVGGGSDFSLALEYNGTVTAWGDNLQGQTNVPANLTNAVAVDGGEMSSLALRSDRTVTVWGSDQDGQTNVPPDLTNAVAAAAGGYHCLALRDDGNPVAWGLDANGQTNIPIGLSNVVEVAAGEYHSLALKNDGTVVAWGNDADGETNVPPGLTNVVEIAAGGYHNLALRSDGTVVAWGYNGNGQTNVPSSLTNVMAVTAGEYHSLALRRDGTVAFWGDSGTGQTNYMPANLTNVFTIAAGGYHNLAVASLYGLNVTNTPPYWTNGLNGTIVTMNELTVTNINNAALDSNAPPQLVFYSLVNPPSFASIDSFSGVITLTPQEVDGPGVYAITTVATDNGYPPLSDTNSFVLVVNEVNTPPFWTNGVPSSTNFTIGVGQTLTVTNTASDSDIPTNPLFYALSVSPAVTNASISTNGIITWTPQATGTYIFTTVVTDTNPPAINAKSLSATNYIYVTVTNQLSVTNAFTISGIVYTNIAGTNGFLLTWFAPTNDYFQVQWTPGLASATWTTFPLPPAIGYNLFISPTNSRFQFFDDGSQTGGTFGPMRFYRLILLQATNTISFLAPANFSVTNGTPLVTVTNQATDSNPNAILTYNLIAAPTNAAISTNGIITWTNAGPAGLAARFTTLVADNELPPATATNTFTIFVSPFPAITNVTMTATNVVLQWSAPTNDLFNVQWTTNLAPPVSWTVFPDTITSTSGLFTFTDTNAPVIMKFYQLILLP